MQVSNVCRDFAAAPPNQRKQYHGNQLKYVGHLADPLTERNFCIFSRHLRTVTLTRCVDAAGVPDEPTDRPIRSELIGSPGEESLRRNTSSSCARSPCRCAGRTNANSAEPFATSDAPIPPRSPARSRHSLPNTMRSNAVNRESESL